MKFYSMEQNTVSTPSFPQLFSATAKLKGRESFRNLSFGSELRPDFFLLTEEKSADSNVKGHIISTALSGHIVKKKGIVGIARARENSPSN